MTWYYSIASDGSSMNIWDHTQDPSTDTPLTTIQNDGSGFTIPDDVLDVMRGETTPELPEKSAAGNSGNASGLSQRGGELLQEMARRDIQEYTG